MACLRIFILLLTMFQKSINVREILAFTISPSKKVLAVSEKKVPSQKGTDQSTSQISIYHTQSHLRVRSINNPNKAHYTSICFSGDSKYLIGVSGEPEQQLSIWRWEKEILYASVDLHTAVTRVCCSPGNLLQVMGSGCEGY